MTKSKKFVSRMMLALLVLTLVSFCFVGFTFARYTSSGTGSATVNVAKWDVTFDSQKDAASGSTTLTLAKLSPSEGAYNASSARTNSTDAVKVATITNKSDVAALVTISTGDLTLNTIASTTSDYDADNAKLPFSIKFYKDADKTTEITSAGFELAAKTGSQDVSQDIYAVVTWTSDGLSDSIQNGDENDTMIAKNVTSVSWVITYTATQNSEIHTA